MNMTQEQLEAGFYRECEMYSSLGAVKQHEIVDKVKRNEIRKFDEKMNFNVEVGHKSARRTSRRK